MNQGFYSTNQNLPQMDYISWSKCSAMLKSPRGFYNKYKLGKQTPPTAAMEFGRAFHSKLLEPENHKSQYAIMPDFGAMQSSTNRAKRDAWKQEYFGKSFLTKEEDEQIDAMIERVREHPHADFLQEGQSEQWGYASRENGGWLMGRPDYLSSDCVIEVKTTSRGVEWDSFFREMLNFNYHAQMALNINVANKIRNVRHSGVFVVVSTAEPYDVAIYELPENILVEGEAIVAEAITKIDQFLAIDPQMEDPKVWQTVELVGTTPPWFFRKTMG